MAHNLSQPYQKLITAVAEINSDAATYLEHEAPKLESFDDLGFDDAPSTILEHAFTWSESPQGTMFWLKIANTLHDKKDLLPIELANLDAYVKLFDGEHSYQALLKVGQNEYLFINVKPDWAEDKDRRINIQHINIQEDSES